MIWQRASWPQSTYRAELATPEGVLKFQVARTGPDEWRLLGSVNGVPEWTAYGRTKAVLVAEAEAIVEGRQG